MNKQLFTKIILVLVVISCGIFNGGRQLNAKVDELETIFMDGENHDGLSIHYDLTKIDDSLSYFLSLAKKYNVNTKAIKTLDTLHKDFNELESIDEYSKWYDEIKSLYPYSINELKGLNLTNQHRSMLNKYEATLNSAMHTIAYSPFNSEVRSYKKESNSLFAKMIKMITGVKGVDSFD